MSLCQWWTFCRNGAKVSVDYWESDMPPWLWMNLHINMSRNWWYPRKYVWCYEFSACFQPQISKSSSCFWHHVQGQIVRIFQAAFPVIKYWRAEFQSVSECIMKHVIPFFVLEIRQPEVIENCPCTAICISHIHEALNLLHSFVVCFGEVNKLVMLFS